MEELQFRISSALKDIIGRDLITDDNIAVFELVKNSYDAYASRVDITFENIYSDNAKIIIKDNGKGMSLEDIKNKWLFVAYSAKKEGTEDDTFDYRDNIYQKRPFAGAKGIGRFSCDRLGERLILESTKKMSGSKTEVVKVDWTNFEEDLQDEFVKVNINHRTRNSSNYGLKHGTVLEISNLRSSWNRTKLLRLKRSLAKLINPNQSGNQSAFKIFLEVDEEKENDKSEKSYSNIINGEIENKIFQTLEFKTTRIESNIDEDGKFISSKLVDGGTIIYEIKQENYFTDLRSIQINLFYLNTSAKQTFARRMGLSTKEYGDVFVYKNGFRIYPYGEPGARDPFQLDFRKSQGFGRNFGTRELIGRIDINSEKIELHETTSRGDGFIENPTKKQFDEYFLDVIRKLERYVVEIQKWGLGIEDLNDLDLFSFNDRSLELIQKVAATENIEAFKVGDGFLKKLKETEGNTTIEILENVESYFRKIEDEKLLDKVKSVSKELEFARKQSQEEREQREKEREKRFRLEQRLNEAESENLFLKSIRSQDLEHVVSFLHHVRISSTLIEKRIKSLLFEVGKEKQDKGKILKLAHGISLENKKINSIARFATKANFKLYTSETEADLVNYIEEYVLNILDSDPEQEPRISLKNSRVVFDFEFKPIEINIVIDNLLSNSRKAGANNVEIEFDSDEKSLMITFRDDGEGLKSLSERSKIFELGYTTTGGSGIGLYHVRQIIENLNGKVSVEDANPKGTIFKIKIEKK